MDLDYGEKHRATIIKATEEHDNKVSSDADYVKFWRSVNDDAHEEILSHNEALDFISCDSDSDIEWNFKKILSHEGPLEKDSPN